MVFTSRSNEGFFRKDTSDSKDIHISQEVECMNVPDIVTRLESQHSKLQSWLSAKSLANTEHQVYIKKILDKGIITDQNMFTLSTAFTDSNILVIFNDWKKSCDFGKQKTVSLIDKINGKSNELDEYITVQASSIAENNSRQNQFGLIFNTYIEYVKLHVPEKDAFMEKFNGEGLGTLFKNSDEVGNNGVKDDESQEDINKNVLSWEDLGSYLRSLSETYKDSLTLGAISSDLVSAIDKIIIFFKNNTELEDDFDDVYLVPIDTNALAGKIVPLRTEIHVLKAEKNKLDSAFSKTFTYKKPNTSVKEYLAGTLRPVGRILIILFLANAAWNSYYSRNSRGASSKVKDTTASLAVSFDSGSNENTIVTHYETPGGDNNPHREQQRTILDSNVFMQKHSLIIPKDFKKETVEHKLNEVYGNLIPTDLTWRVFNHLCLEYGSQDVEDLNLYPGTTFIFVESQSDIPLRIPGDYTVITKNMIQEFLSKKVGR